MKDMPAMFVVLALFVAAYGAGYLMDVYGVEFVADHFNWR